MNKVVVEELASAERPDAQAVRVEHVGSLVKPDSLKQAYCSYVQGTLSGEALQAALDLAVGQVVREQEARGLPLVTDGEYRRSGLDPDEAAGSVATSALAEFQFVHSLTNRLVKIAVPSPVGVFRGAQRPHERSHGSPEDNLSATVAAERRRIGVLVDAGCEYVQIDLPANCRLDTTEWVARLRGFGQDPLALLVWSIWANNEVVADIAGRATTALHICGGNEPAGQDSVKHDDHMAERFFGSLCHDRLLVDCQARLDYHWLRYVPTDKTVVLGLVSTRPAVAETVDDITRRVEQASRYHPVDRLAIGPTCGFSASPDHGAITVDQQWRKLETLLRGAEKIWGSAVSG
jgi:5-methyltetrahydropteroyltriglutamate--homocysteine methyltransferase